MGCNYSKQSIIDTTYETLPTFSFNRFKKKVKVIKVYDGDTIWVAMKHFNMVFKIKVRLVGIDTPEIRTKDINEKEKGLAARDFLKSIIDNKIITLDCGNFDKYGRLLGTVYYNNMNINKVMIVNKHAVEYDGKTKTSDKNI